MKKQDTFEKLMVELRRFAPPLVFPSKGMGGRYEAAEVQSRSGEGARDC